MNVRSRNNSAGNSGSAWLTERHATTAPSTIVTAKSCNTVASSQPSVSAREMPHTNAPTAAVKTKATGMSGRFPPIRGDSVVIRHAINNRTKQIGTLIQKAERHPNVATKNAPRVGPDATPRAPIEPVQAITCPRFSAGNAANKSPIDAGVIIAPPIP